MEKLSSDLLFSLAIHLDLYDILNLCKTHKEINRKLCKNIWNYKLSRIEDQESIEKLKGNLNSKKLYELVYSLIKVKEAFKLKENIYDLYNSDYLNLNKVGHIKEIPREIDKLSNLKYLYLHKNQISEIPKELCNLSNLEKLVLSNNQIKTVPKELGNLSNLQLLHLSHNQIEIVPKELANLSNLNYLYLYNNNISEIPTSLANLSKLFHFDFSDNKITKIPRKLKRLPIIY